MSRVGFEPTTRRLRGSCSDQTELPAQHQCTTHTEDCQPPILGGDLHPRPVSELSGSSTRMTVRTPHITLRYFCLDSLQGKVASDHRRNVSYLLATNMVEVQDDWVGFPAIYTWMPQEILAHPLLPSLNTPTCTRDSVRHVFRMRFPVGSDVVARAGLTTGTRTTTIGWK